MISWSHSGKSATKYSGLPSSFVPQWEGHFKKIIIWKTNAFYGRFGDVSKQVLILGFYIPAHDFATMLAAYILHCVKSIKKSVICRGVQVPNSRLQIEYWIESRKKSDTSNQILNIRKMSTKFIAYKFWPTKHGATHDRESPGIA